MEPFVTMGLVLKETQYREADRILTILTPKLGVISALAKNSMRVTNKLFSGCGLFCYSEFTLVKGRSMYVVQEADVENVFYDVSKSLEGVGVAMYLAEMTYTLSPTGQEAEKELRLLLNCLYMISKGKADPRVVKAVFELRTMSECGFMPQLACCRDCGAYEGDTFYLDVQEGHLLCADCAAKAGKSCNLDRGALYALRHICLVDDKKNICIQNLSGQPGKAFRGGRALCAGPSGQAAEKLQLSKIGPALTQKEYLWKQVT